MVSRLAEFGAFVQIAPGIDGLVHVSEAALGRVRHVKDVLAVGDTVEVMVVGVDPVKRRIALSVKQALAGQAGAEPSPVQPPAASPAPPPASAAASTGQSSTELTPMAIALRKAMEKARERGQT